MCPAQLLQKWLCGIYHVPKCMSCQEATLVVTRKAHSFNDCIYISLILLLWHLSNLCVVDHLKPLITYLSIYLFIYLYTYICIKTHIHVYLYIYIYIYPHICMSVCKHETHTFNIKYTWFSTNKLGPPTELKKKNENLKKYCWIMQKPIQSNEWQSS